MDNKEIILRGLEIITIVTSTGRNLKCIIIGRNEEKSEPWLVISSNFDHLCR